MMAQAPQCKLCEHRHWARDPHVFGKTEAKPVPAQTLARSSVALADPREVVAAADNKSEAIIALLGQARQWLVEATKIEDVLERVAYAEAIRAYSVQAKLGREAEQAAVEIRVRAERRIGELISESQELGEIRVAGNPILDKTDSIIVDDDNWHPASLSQLGITPNQSSQFKRLAAADEQTFDITVGKLKDKGALSRSSVLRELDTTEAKRKESRIDKVLGEIRRLLAEYPDGEVNLLIRLEIEHLEALKERIEDANAD